MALVAFAALPATAGCNGVASTVADPMAINGDVPPELQRVAQAYSILLQEHVDHGTLDPEQLTDGAIRGLLMALDDPHASYLSAEQHAREQEGYRGFFEGIGAQVTLSEAGVTVIAPIPGAPAEAAGILPGDVILAVDGGKHRRTYAHRGRQSNPRPGRNAGNAVDSPSGEPGERQYLCYTRSHTD